ncbi:ATP-binding protein [Streptomyces sp. N35]|uniref:ATP-binding protein n=1 Tax=Streptomyces sp. N35 TaxID=2795730 RepID=UPI0018F5E015|nr:ATP-binding protein [Streptomyces sp. N35]
MSTRTLKPHLTWRFSDPAGVSVKYPDRVTFGWGCQSLPACQAGRSRYLDERDAHRDADEHEREEARKLFAPGTLVVTIGPAGSGKSRFAMPFPASWVVNLDELRGRLADDPGEQAVTRPAVQLQNILVATRMERGLITVVDSTNVEASVRAGLLTKARTFGRPAAAVVFLTDLGNCLIRNERRPASRRVRRTTVCWQHEQTAAALKLLTGEGFDAVYTVGAPRT